MEKNGSAAAGCNLAAASCWQELKLQLNSGSRVTLGDRVESDGRVFITTGYSSQLNIGSGVYFNDGAVISCLGKIDIGENTLFGPGVKDL